MQWMRSQDFLSNLRCLVGSSLLLNVVLIGVLWACSSTENFTSRTNDAIASEGRSRGGEDDSLQFDEFQRHLSSDSGSGDHGSHPQEALLFLFNAVIFGVVLLQLTAFPSLHHMQQSVAIFVLGMLYSLVQEGLKFNQHFGILGRSYDMWMGIDPHLMLFTMLPALLAGDAMALDTNVVKRVAGQCMYLAGPGVLCNLLLAAGFLKLYLGSYDWPFELCLTTGAILAATDPVAVVSLLKQLGAAPSLTILIQGESLLNDGTAIVCFVLFYDMLQGVSFGFGQIVLFIVRKAICACGLGWVIGWVFVVWISAASNRFDHRSGMIQICLTICCAYWSFIIAEGVLDMSGVLCTVSASLVLADNMWASVVDKHTLLHVWHVIEFLGNTIIFFLAGALTGNCMVHILIQDYLNLLVIYIVLTIIRGSVIIGSLPILRRLGKADLPLSEALVMTWGGLRGAVGLALAIQVSIEKAGGKVSDMDARRVLFFTGGVAFLTLVINAVTCPALVKFLGLVQMDEVKRSLLMKVCSQMIKRVQVENLKEPVRRALEEMMERSDHSLALAYSMHVTRLNSSVHDNEGSATTKCGDETNLKHTSTPQPPRRNSMLQAVSSAGDGLQGLKERIRLHLSSPETCYDPGIRLIELFDEVLVKMETLPSDLFSLMNIPPAGQLGVPEKVQELLQGLPDPQKMELINASLLTLVQAEYWTMIEEGEFIRGSSHPELLLNSIAWAMQSKSARLGDYAFLVKDLGLQNREKPKTAEDSTSDSVNKRSSIQGPSGDGQTYSQALQLSALIADGHIDSSNLSCLGKFVTSTCFNVAITITIMLNVVNVFIEENNMKDKTGKEYGFWLFVEICFIGIFFSEMVLKLCAFGRHYFYDSWNVFDFLLVLLGVFGIFVELFSDYDDSDVSSEARVFRLNKLFRAMRLMRVFRLVQLLTVLRARWSGLQMSLHLAKNMRVISILTAFARAHHKAEKKLIKFFGSPLKFGGSELARCIIDSRISTCNAICAAAFEMGRMELVILERLAALRESGNITEELSHFILDAGSLGVMNAKEAEHMLKPLREQQQQWFNEEKHHLAGMYDRTNVAEFAKESQFRRDSRKMSDASMSSSPHSVRTSLRQEMAHLENPFDLRRACEPDEDTADVPEDDISCPPRSPMPRSPMRDLLGNSDPNMKKEVIYTTEDDISCPLRSMPLGGSDISSIH